MTGLAKTGRLDKESTTLVVFMVGLSLMSYIDRTLISIAGPEMMREFGISETRMGTVYSAFILGYAVMMLPGGWLADRWRSRLVLTLMGAGAAVCTALTPLLTDSQIRLYLPVVTALAAVRFLLGLVTAPLYPALARLTANWIPLQLHTRVQGLIIAGAPLGAALTSFAFPWFIAGYGWRVGFYIAAVATVVLTLLWRRCILDYPQQPVVPGAPGQRVRGDAHPGWRSLLRNRNLALLAAGYFTLGYFEYIFFYWIYYYFGEVRGLPRSESAVYTTILLLSMMVAMPCAGWISDRLSPRFGTLNSRRMIAGGGMAMSAICLYLGTRAIEPVSMVALLSLALALASSAEAPYWAAVIDVGGRHVGAAGGILNAVGNVGGVLAPVLTPLIASRFGWSLSLHFASGLILVGAALWLLIQPDRETGEGSERPEAHVHLGFQASDRHQEISTPPTY